jgi:hypothetical protein
MLICMFIPPVWSLDLCAFSRVCIGIQALWPPFRRVHILGHSICKPILHDIASKVRERRSSKVT